MPRLPQAPTGRRWAQTAPANQPPRVSVDVDAGKFRLRTLKPQDVAPDWLEWISDPVITEGLNASPRAMTLEEMRAYVSRFDQFVRSLVGILDKRTNAVVGLVMIEVDPRHLLASVHMLVGNKRYWGRKAAIAAGEAVVRHLFDQRKLEKVTFCPLSNNQPAIAVCLYHQLRLEGIFRSHRAVAGGKRLDQLQFALTREEYLERKRAEA